MRAVFFSKKRARRASDNLSFTGEGLPCESRSEVCVWLAQPSLSLCLPGILYATTYLGEDRLCVPLAPTGHAPHHQIHVGAVAWLFRLAFALAPAP